MRSSSEAPGLAFSAGRNLPASVELRDQSRQGFRLLTRGEVTARQPLEPKAEFAQPFLREVDLPVFKGIFVASPHQERDLIAIDS